MMYGHGPGNGTLMLLPIDQGLEHGPIDFFDNPDALDTDWVLRLAVEGNFSGIAYHIGLAEKYHQQYAGRVPLVLKVNGKTNIPPDDDFVQPADIERRRRGAARRERRRLHDLRRLAGARPRHAASQRRAACVREVRHAADNGGPIRAARP